MSPPQDIGDQALLGSAQPSGSASRSTASDNAFFCCGSQHPVALTTAQYWNGTVWDDSGTAVPDARVFVVAGGNHDDYIIGGGADATSGTASEDTFEWNGTAWTAEGSGYPQMGKEYITASFGGNTSSAFAHSGRDNYTSAPYYKTYSSEWNGDSWTSSVSSLYGGQGNAGGGLPDDFIASAGYGYNQTGSLIQTWKTESFNGIAWTVEEDFPTDAADNMSAYAYGNFAAGGRESFLAFANTDSLTNVAFTYDGDSWEAAGTLADPVMYAASGGDSSSAMTAGGADNGWDVVTSQLYNGTTFTSKPDIDVGVTGGGMGANTV